MGSPFNDATTNFNSQNNGFDTKAIFSSTSTFFDPSLSDVFASDFPDTGLGLDYDYNYDEGFTLNGIRDSFCKEARAQATEFEKNVRQFEAQFGDGQNTFPSLSSGGSFDSSSTSFGKPTPRPGPRPTSVVVTPFPKVASSRPPARTPTRPPPSGPKRPTPRQTLTTRRPSAAPTQVVVTRRKSTTPAPTKPPTARPTRVSTIPTKEKPKSASLPTTRRPATTGSPVSWSFNGESLGGENSDREGRTTKKSSPAPNSAGPSSSQEPSRTPSKNSRDLPVDSFFSAGDPNGNERDGAVDGTLFSVFDAVPK